MKRILASFIVSLCLLFSAADPVLADPVPPAPAAPVNPVVVTSSEGFLGDLNTQLNATAGDEGAQLGPAADPRVVVALIIRYAIGLLGVGFIAYTVYAGFIIMTASGNSDKIDEGKATLRRAVIGLVIILNAYAISWWVSTRLARVSGLDTSEYIKIEEDRTRFRMNDPLYEGTPVPTELNRCQVQPDGSRKCF